MLFVMVKTKTGMTVLYSMFLRKFKFKFKMVKEGWAIAYRYYSKDYVKDEETARKLKKGYGKALLRTLLAEEK